MGERREAAMLCLNSWAGLHEEPVFIIGETAKRYRITVERRTKIAGRQRYLNPGDDVLVPKRAIRKERNNV